MSKRQAVSLKSNEVDVKFGRKVILRMSIDAVGVLNVDRGSF